MSGPINPLLLAVVLAGCAMPPPMAYDGPYRTIQHYPYRFSDAMFYARQYCALAELSVRPIDTINLSATISVSRFECVPTSRNMTGSDTNNLQLASR